jgi:nicotinamidase-related amidase
LLLIDFINLLPGGDNASLGPRAAGAARNAALLKHQAKAARLPVIYANDNFGDWQADFPSLVQKCRRRRGYAHELAEILRPSGDDFSVLKPMHSAFYGTPLEFLLDELAVRRLILTGVEADICVLFTAQDAYMRKYELWVPANCVASRSERRLRSALEFMRHNLKASTRATGRTATLRESGK